MEVIYCNGNSKKGFRFHPIRKIARSPIDKQQKANALFSIWVIEFAADSNSTGIYDAQLKARKRRF